MKSTAPCSRRSGDRDLAGRQNLFAINERRIGLGQFHLRHSVIGFAFRDAAGKLEAFDVYQHMQPAADWRNHLVTASIPGTHSILGHSALLSFNALGIGD